ncbi:MAG: VacJ family lipoprotein [Holosporales bacterium]|nr:VacJ family lipoprotein [Holosporales bacterium]
MSFSARISATLWAIALISAGLFEAQAEEAEDPFESINRAVFEFNLFFDEVVLVPVSFVYSKVVPDPIAKGIKNVLGVLRTPISFTCHVLSGEGEKAALTLMRGIVNLVFGFLGFVDVATEIGLTVEQKTVGQLLGCLNIGTGPYLMIPFWGPSNPRDLFGDIVEGIYDPVGRAGPLGTRRWSYWGCQAVIFTSTRAGVLDVERAIRDQSPDYYVTFRCLYWQKLHGNAAEDTPTPLEEEDFVQ